MSGHVQVISILMRKERPVIYSRGNTGRNARAGCFSLHLDFLFELNEVCTRRPCEEEVGWGGARGRGQGWREMARSRKDVLHLPIQSVAFSNFEMKERGAGRFAAGCIALNSKVRKKKKKTRKKPGSAWRGILHAGHF